MRILAAEVCITPQGQPEVEVGMLPLDLDLPGPWVGTFGRTVTVRLTLHTSRGDLTIRQQVTLRDEEPPEQFEARSRPVTLPRDQYLALVRSVERGRRDDDLLEIHARLPHRPIAPSDHAVAMYPTAS